jgi:coatomer protein complex subunit alpha (xenin)
MNNNNNNNSIIENEEQKQFYYKLMTHYQSSLMYNNEQLKSKLKEALKLTSNQSTIQKALNLYREIIQWFIMVKIESKKGVREMEEIVSTCVEYITALTMELKKREIQSSDPKRAAELAAYFTRCKLQNTHLNLGLSSAMGITFKMKNFVTASLFAQRLLQLGPPEKMNKQAKYVIQKKGESQSDEQEINYDERNPFVICNSTFTPVYAGSEKVTCSYCKANYLPKFKDQLCNVCQLGTIGNESFGGIYQYRLALAGGSFNEKQNKEIVSDNEDEDDDIFDKDDF